MAHALVDGKVVNELTVSHKEEGNQSALTCRISESENSDSEEDGSICKAEKCYGIPGLKICCRGPPIAIGKLVNRGAINDLSIVHVSGVLGGAFQRAGLLARGYAVYSRID